jgi:hypothetical protein
METSDFRNAIAFSAKHFEKRIQYANQLVGEKQVKWIIALALFFLGGKREQISQFIQIPVGTFYSFLTRFHHIGLKALMNQREKTGSAGHGFTADRMVTPDSEQKPTHLEIVCGSKRQSILIPDGTQLVLRSSNHIQFKTLMLSFLNAGLITFSEACELLDIGQRRLKDLCKILEHNDIDTLIDRRRGQQKDYLVTEQVKAEIIQQFALNLASGRSTASPKIAKQVNDVCRIVVSERAIRQHIAKLGLDKLKKTLPDLLTGVKKSSKI